MALLKWMRCLLPLLMLAMSHAAPERKQVLILADPAYRNAAGETAKLLKPQADVTVSLAPSKEIYHTGTALVHLDAWLGEKPWDLVVFNVGLTDLVHRAPGMKSFRVLSREAGGVRTTSSQAYRENLAKLAEGLQAKSPKVIWLNTLPIQRSLLGIREPGAEIELNEIADSVMSKAGVTVLDMHAHALSILTEKEIKGQVEPKTFAKKPIHLPLVAAICQDLDLAVPAPPEHPAKK